MFPRASDAIACAASLREALAAASWPASLDLRVRIALHTGEAHERDGDYFGPALNRAARLRALADGGVTLLSQATKEIVHDRLPAGTELVDLGTHELRDLSRPERVFELREAGAAGAADLPAALREIRKTVTVLFAGRQSTPADPEALDAEARRRVSSHALAGVRAVLERHGATVQDYPGDVLMAVFGIPLLHEDDALRAVRAAAELRQAVPALAGELGPALSIELGTCAGIATGEVITDRSARSELPASGETVNAAKHLQELADTGRDPHRRGHAPTGPRRRDGRPGPLDGTARRGGRAAYLLGAVRAEPARAARRRLAPGRPRAAAGCALRRLRGRRGRPRLPSRDRARGRPASGSRASSTSSRAASAAAPPSCAAAASPTARASPTGRCPSSCATWRVEAGGDPAADVREAVVDELAGEPQADLIADVLAEAIGLRGTGGHATEKIFWAARRLFEALARRRPLVVVLDDLQWAEPTFLDLVEHVADWRATRRSSCCAWRGPSCSRAAPAGRAAS